MESLKNLTSTEISIYNYILANINKIPSMNIRYLANRTNASTSSIIRCLKKMGYSGFQEFKYGVSNRLKYANSKPKKNDLISYEQNYFNQNLEQRYKEKINSIKKIILSAKEIVFFGIGTSGILAQYGARQFSNFGLNAKFINDPFFPLNLRGINKSSVGIVLSVSGETSQIIKMTKNFKQLGSKVISITNNNFNSVAQLSDLNLDYNIKEETIHKTLNVTTQAPVIFLLDLIVRNIN